MKEKLALRARFELATLRLTAEMVEILNALSCVAYRETRPIFSPSVGLLGLPIRVDDIETYQIRSLIVLTETLERTIEICQPQGSVNERRPKLGKLDVASEKRSNWRQF